ncbi:MAG: DUF2946 family protein [Alphaproteobacteria bacterium]|nr:DUF2946 family protein [Alphaproteobacteria bacterium]
MAIRPKRLRFGTIAAWLGIIALCLNALVPIHLAFDLADALTASDHTEGADAGHGLAHTLLALLVGHHHHQDRSAPHKPHHHNDGCAVCGVVGTLAGFAPAAVAQLAAPGAVFVATLGFVEPPAPQLGPVITYRSRAPPLA